MILLDVNVLVYAYREDAECHTEYRAWLDRTLEEEAVIGVAEFVLASVVRVTTHPKIFAKPSKLADALGFCDYMREQENVIVVAPGKRHWTLFKELSRNAGSKGNTITDAYIAALAQEHGAEMITADRDFARFAGIHCRHPLNQP